MISLRNTAAAALALVLTGCIGSNDTVIQERHYSLLLDALQSPVVSTPTEPATATIAVLPVQIPEYLRSRNLVMQVGDNEVLPARRHFWAEPLEESIRQVLRHDLDASLGITAVSRQPNTDVECHLFVAFERFHATDRARVVASGRYRLITPGGIYEHDFDVSREQRGDGYSAAVSELRRSVASLADEIVSELDLPMLCEVDDSSAETE